mgnify:CR=1 FL=1
MTWKKLQRLLACLLAVLLLSQVGAFLPAARAAGGYTLQNGSAIIKPGMSDGEVNRALTRALVVGFDQMSEADQNALLDSLQWEYYCEGKDTKTGLIKHSDWGKIGGFESSTKKLGITTNYTHPALAKNDDGNYQVRVEGGSGQEVRLEKRTGLASSISLKSGVSVALTYNADGSLNFDALRAAILEQVVASSTPVLTLQNTEIKYYAESKTTGLSHQWVKLEGDKINLATYPAISAGEQKIQISFYGNDQYTGSSAEVNVTFVDRADAHIVLKEGQTVNLQYTEAVTIDFDALRMSILAQVVDEGTTPSLTAENTEIKYYATSSTGLTHEWVKLDGDKVNLATYPAISAGDQQIQISFKGDDAYKASSATTTVTFIERPSVQVTKKENPTFKLAFNDDGTAIYDNIQQQVFDAVIQSTDPTLTAGDVSIKYLATEKVLGVDSHEWMPLTGGKKNEISYPAIGEGTQKVRISWGGNRYYAPMDLEAEVLVTGRPALQVTLKDSPSVKLVFNDDGKVIYDNIYQQVWDAVIERTEPELTLEQATLEYYADSKATGWVSEWVPLEGGKKNSISYPGVSEGTQKVRVSWRGTSVYAPGHVDVDVLFLDRDPAPFHLKTGVTEGMPVAIVYNRDQSINYEATEQALREALIKSTDSNYSVDLVKVEYNIYGTAITDDRFANYKDLSYKVLDSDLLDGIKAGKFGLGDQLLRLSWRGNADYKPFEETQVRVKMVDNRQPTEVVLKSGASITYNMDTNVMLQAIFENLIDWDASTLPEKSTLSVADFTFEYYGENVLGEEDGGISGGAHDWAPVAGGKVNMLTYPQMGAGENQKVRVSYSGNGEYRPCKNVEGTLTVNKAKVTVKVHSTSIYAEEAKDKLGEGFITTDPADKFDIYTIYGGVTSNVTTSVFVQLPERLTNSTVLKIVDKALELAGQPTLSEMMQNGTTVGALRKILSDVISKGDDLPTFIKDALKKAGIDIDTLVKLNDALSKLPGLLDNVRVAFGTPDQAGIYTVCAVTNNKNYETGFGMGALVVKKHYSGVKLQWNQTIPNGKLTAEEAADFDFSVTLMYNGEPAAKQTNVHYLYSGITSKWKPYSSTSTPPTEPGRYVMTVVTLGGNYQAAPITRSFQITK